MKESEIFEIVETQRQFFKSNQTLNIKYRINALKTLKKAIEDNLEEINEAIKKDLGKSRMESYMCETGLTLSEITYMLKHTRSFSKDKRIRTPLAQFCSRSFVKRSPYGTVLIMSPWNYPFLLTMEPLVDAIAAGNTVIIKPSAYSPATSAVIEKLVKLCFPAEYVAVVTGGRQENTSLLNQHFDYIFFTGSQAVGREVMLQASKNLTPVTLELGGKSPCIVEESANIKLAAKRIVFGKYLNCGQTCVAPDYILCHSRIKPLLIEEIKKQIKLQFGENPLNNESYGKIINEKHFDRILGLIDKEKLVCGGESDRNTLKIAPTVLDNVVFEDAVMGQEIFGPILPILTFDEIHQAIDFINLRPHPLALYIFTEKKSIADKCLSQCGFGGGCVNDTIIHLATSNMGFGGFGESGMGSYHGKEGFETFSHKKSIVDKKTWLDLPMRYQPYKSINEALVRFFLK